MTEPTSSPFHEGERRVQERLGVHDEIEPWARKVVRPSLPEQHQAFYAELPFLVVGARDGRGRPWATILAGEPGFLRARDAETLGVNAKPVPGDALADALEPGADLGVLGIEPNSRRRNRLTGRVASRDEAGLTLAVDQAFGNCPQYIHERRYHFEPTRPAAPQRTTSLSPDQRRRIASADTFFIATGHRGTGEHPAFGMDASHRGGPEGFVRVTEEGTLVFPDYAGNNHFNTLGNLEVDPRAGLLFVDFERGDLLQLTGRARVDWEPGELADFPGAQRLVHFELEEAVLLERALPIRWERSDDERLDLRVLDRIDESDEVTSFVLGAPDDSSLPGFEAGQHLPIEVSLPDAGPATRTYSLSSAPGEAPDRYRITVKREALGQVSGHLHRRLRPGHTLPVRAPRGDFTLQPTGGRPVVLASAGVGLTPLVSMLHELARSRAQGPVWFVHGARDGSKHALRREVEQLVEAHPGLQLHTVYSRPRPGDAHGVDYHSVGRVDAELLEKLAPGLDGDFYLCGPQGFMSDLQDGLEARGVPDGRIHTESFGPSA